MCGLMKAAGGIRSAWARALRRAAGAVALAAAALVAPAPALADAEADRGWLTGFLESSLSGAGREVRITGFAGALSARATIEELTIADGDGVWLILRGAVLDWNRPALIARRLEINELAAAEIIVLRAPRADPDGIDLPTPEARPFGLPELPITIRIDRIAAERVELGEALLGEVVELALDGSAGLAGGTGRAELTVARIDGAEGRMALRIGFDNETRRLETDLSLSEATGGVAARLLSLPGMPSVDMMVDGAGPLDDFAARVALATDGVERFGGGVTLRGASDAGLSFSADLGGDLRPLLPEDLHAFFGADTRLSAAGLRREEGGFDLTDFALTAEAAQLSGALRIGATGLPDFARLRGRIASADGAPVVLPSAERRTIASAELTLDFDAAVSENWSLTLRADGLTGPDLSVVALALEGGGQIAAGEGGRSISLDLGLVGEGIAPADPALAEALGDSLSGQVSLSWTEGSPVAIRTLSLAGRGLRLDAEGTIDGTAIDGQLNLIAPDIARFSALAGRDLGGGITGAVEGTLSPLSGIFDLRGRLTGTDLTIGEPEVDGLLAGTSGIALDIRRDETGTRIRSLDIGAQNLLLDASGFISSVRTEIAAELDFSDLSVLGPGYGGAMRAGLQLSGPPDTLRLAGSGTGRDVRLGQPVLDGLFADTSRFDIDLTLGAERLLTVDRLEFETPALGASVSGLVALARSAELRIAAPSDLEFTLDFRNPGVFGPGFGGQLQASGRLLGTDEGERILLSAQSRDLRLGQPPLNVLFRGTTQLDLTATRRGERYRIEALELRNPQLTVGASATVEGATRRLEVSGRITDIGVLADQLEGPGIITGLVTEAPGGYQLQFSAQGPGGLNLEVAGRVTPALIHNVTIRGDADMALASRFLDDILVQGPVRVDLRMLGAPRIESLSGQISVRGGRIVAPRQYVTLQNVNGTADLGSGRLSLAVTGSAARGGSFRLSGPIFLRPGFPVDLTGLLDEMRIVDPTLYSTSVSGSLGIRGPLMGGGALISGALSLGSSEIRVPNAGYVGATHIPEGIRHIGEPESARLTRIWARVADVTGEGSRSNRPFALDLSLSAPNRVFIRGRGLDAEVGGTLVLRGTTANVIPSGEFGLIRGRIDILGNRFSLTEGFASLQGRFIPFIRLAASTEADGITARIVVEGVATEPRISFTSSPELPEEEVVSRLLFGRDLGSLSPFQAAQLASAVATLSGRGGIGVMERLRENFGLDDLDFTTDETGTASVRAGAYIAENIYTDLRVDAAGRSEITINLDVSPSVTLRGRAGTDGRSGVGVFFERDY